MSLRLDYIPRRLRRARARVVELHPGTVANPRELPAPVLEQLRNRIAAAGANPSLLDAIAGALTAREVRALVGGLERWEDLRPSVLHVLCARIDRSHAPLVWRAWQRNPLVAEIKALATHLGTRFGWAQLAGPSFASQAESWVRAADPGEQIRRWLAENGLSYSDLPHVASLPLQPDTPLFRLVREAVLINGTTAQLRTEGDANISAWIEELAPELKLRSQQNYLAKLPADEWGWPVLVPIERAYGLPLNPRIPRFWEPLPEEVRKAFQQYVIRRKLRKMFGDQDRYGYWQRWSGDLLDVEYGRAGDTPYGVLLFGGFGVVEFFEYGNAAYFYPAEDLARLTRGMISNPQDLKELMYLHGTSNRLIHNHGWHERATQMVHEWITSFGRG